MTIPFLGRSPAHGKVGYGGLGEKIQVTTDDGDWRLQPFDAATCDNMRWTPIVRQPEPSSKV
jgi:hypothetical protein